MNAQSAKTPTPRESVTITLTPEEQHLLISLLRDNFYANSSKNCKPDLNRFLSRFSKLVFKSGDACRHSAQSSDAVGQGGTITCHLCEGQGTYTKPSFLKLFQCEICRGAGFISVDSVGQGGTNV